MTQMAKIILKKNEERRLNAGHQWIFSNEIDKIEDLNEDICICSLHDSRGAFLGKGFYNRHSLIAYRHLTSKDEEIDEKFFFKRLSKANALRKRVKPDSNVYRLSNGEADLLPGLIVDKYDDRYSVQIFSAGMDRMISVICNVLKENFKAKLIVEKNMNSMRNLEGIELREGVLHSDTEAIEKGFECDIDGIKYSIDLLKGQKSGFYLDQSENRTLIRKYLRKGESVLDLFCNDGGFALNAAYSGAGEITAVDSSKVAVERTMKNFDLNGFRTPELVERDCFEYINDLFQTTKRFDFIIVDPPSFTKSKKAIRQALRAYMELNYKCMRLLKPDSLMFSFSCSHHIHETTFEEMLADSASKAGKTLQLLEKRTCSFDHPVLPQMHETSYLKGYLVRVI